MSASDPLSQIPTRPAGAPPFDAPWQARAFALTLALHAGGAFTWSEWTTALARERAREGDREDDFHAAWLRALQALAATKGLAAPAEVAAADAAWRRAARATPHGAPIRLDAGRP